MSSDDNDPLRQRATTWVDTEHRREAQALRMCHIQSERSMLNDSLNRIHSLKQNRAGIDDRYRARVASIGERKNRVAETIRVRHNSIGGRLQAMTAKGRAAQTQEFERLNGRARQLVVQAGKNQSLHLARHDRQMTQTRQNEAQRIRSQRIDNRQSRRDYHQNNIKNRPNQIQDRVAALRQEQQMKQVIEHKQEFNRRAQPGLTQEFNQQTQRRKH